MPHLDEEGEHCNHHLVIARGGYRCTAPACRARRQLESHHIQYKGRGGTRSTTTPASTAGGCARGGVLPKS